MTGSLLASNHSERAKQCLTVFMCVTGGTHHARKTFSIATKSDRHTKTWSRAGSKQWGSHSFTSPVLKLCI